MSAPVALPQAAETVPLDAGHSSNVLSVLYVFAGKQRKSDVRSYLAQMWQGHLDLVELDTERSPDHDVLSGTLWAQVLADIRAGRCKAAFFTPPCNTWSRARFSNRKGPKPMRNREWPWGFPWLEKKFRTQCEQGNALVRLTLQGCQACQDSGTCLL